MITFSNNFKETSAYSKLLPYRLLDRCHTCNFIARFCRATLSGDKIASVTWRVAQLLNSRATLFPIRAALYSVQLCHEKAMNER